MPELNRVHTRDPRAHGDLPSAWVSAIIGVCGLTYFGQSFSAWAWPALDGYPAIERWLNPDFLPGDFYTNTTDVYGVDTWQAVLFGGWERLTSVPYALTIAVLTALRLLAFPAVIYAFFTGLLGRGPAALLAVTLGTLANFDLPHTLGWQWLWGDGSPAMFAALAATGAWALLLRRRIWPSLLLMAVAAIAQPLVAVHGGIFYALVFFLDFDGKERLRALTSPANLAAGAVFAAAFLSQYALLSPRPNERLPELEYLQILVWERHPSDFLPSRFHLREIIAFFVAAAGVLIMLARIWRDLPRRALIVGTLVVYALICLGGWWFVEIRPLRLAADLIPYRTVLFGAPLILAVIGAFAAEAYRKRAILTLALLFAAFALAGPLAKGLHIPSLVPAGVLLVAGLAGTSAGAGLTALGGLIGPPLWALSVIGLFGQGAVAAYARRAEMILPTTANQHPVYAWTKTKTPPDATFLVEQKASDPRYTLRLSPQHMRLLGRRTVVASMDYPFADRDLRAWRKTWADGLDHGRRDFVETADAQRLAQICLTLPYDYVVRTRPVAGLTPAATFAPSHDLPSLSVYRPCADKRS